MIHRPLCIAFGLVAGLGLARPAVASPIRIGEIEAEVERLIPHVEALSGRSLHFTPSVELVTTDTARIRMETVPEILQAYGLPARMPLSARHQDEITFLAEDAVAIYRPGHRDILVIQNRLSDVAGLHGLDPEGLRAVVRCVLVHELTHAIQEQYVPPSESTDARAYDSMLLEGQATWVGHRYCRENEGPATSRVADSLLMGDIPGSIPLDHPAAPYTLGERVVDRLHAAGGPEATWGAFRIRDTAVEVLGPIAREGLPVGWADASLIRETAEVLGQTTAEVGPTSPTELLGTLLVGGVEERPSPPLAGTAGFATGNRRDGFIFTAWFPEPGAPEAYLDARRRSLKQERRSGSVTLLTTARFATKNLYLRRIPGWRKRDAVQDTLRFDANRSGVHYHERWIATDHELVVVTSTLGMSLWSELDDVAWGLLRETGRDDVHGPPDGVATDWIARAAATDPGGGGIAALGGATITDVLLDSNGSYRRSGGGAFLSGEVEITDSTFEANATTTAALLPGGSGGGVAWLDGAGSDITLRSSGLGDNSAGETGGGLYLVGHGTGSTATLEGVILDRNDADMLGGGLYADVDELRIQQSVVERNQAVGTGPGHGGGLYIVARTPTTAPLIDQCGILFNEADGDGGGVYVEVDSASATGTHVVRNTTVGENVCDGSTTGHTGCGLAVVGPSTSPAVTVRLEHVSVVENETAGGTDDAFRVGGAGGWPELEYEMSLVQGLCDVAGSPALTSAGGNVMNSGSSGCDQTGSGTPTPIGSGLWLTPPPTLTPYTPAAVVGMLGTRFFPLNADIPAAIDVATCSTAITVDQNGTSRPTTPGDCDAGSHEL